MIRILINTTLWIFGVLMLTGCFADSRYNYKKKSEKQELFPRTQSELLMQKFDRSALSQIPTFNERMEKSRGARGLIAPFSGDLISYGTTALKTVITNQQNKFTAVSKFSKTDLYFYDQPSSSGPFDPAGMQFTGFDLVRTIEGKDGNLDTAFIASFELDTSKATEILNNSVFNLKLKDFRLKYVKPKVGLSGSRKISVEFDISFITSYVNDKGNIFDSVVLGRFHLLLKDISINMNDSNYGRFVKKPNEKEPELTGKSFVVPRSFGYFKVGDNLVTGYNQGSYSILATVKESTRPSFATRLIIQNGSSVITTTSPQISTQISTLIQPPAAVAPAKKN